MAHFPTLNLGRKPRVFDLLMYTERREFDNCDCYWAMG